MSVDVYLYWFKFSSRSGNVPRLMAPKLHSHIITSWDAHRGQVRQLLQSPCMSLCIPQMEKTTQKNAREMIILGDPFSKLLFQALLSQSFTCRACPCDVRPHLPCSPKPARYLLADGKKRHRFWMKCWNWTIAGRCRKSYLIQFWFEDAGRCRKSHFPHLICWIHSLRLDPSPPAERRGPDRWNAGTDEMFHLCFCFTTFRLWE